MANVPRSGWRRLRDSWPDSRRTFRTSNVWPRRRWNGWVTVAKPKERLAWSAVRWVCGDAERPLSAIRLRYVPPTGRQRSIRSRMDPCVEANEVVLELLPVLVPRDLVDAWGSPLLQAEERPPKAIDVDVVQKRCQSLLVVPVDGLTYAILRLWHGFPALCPVRALQHRIPLGPTASLHRFRHGSHRFVHRLPRYYQRV